MKPFIRIFLLGAINLNFLIPDVNEGLAQSTRQFQLVKTPTVNGDMRTSYADSAKNKLKFINTAFENASPLDWEVDSNGVVHVNLIL